MGGTMRKRLVNNTNQRRWIVDIHLLLSGPSHCEPEAGKGGCGSPDIYYRDQR